MLECTAARDDLRVSSAASNEREGEGTHALHCARFSARRNVLPTRSPPSLVALATLAVRSIPADWASAAGGKTWIEDEGMKPQGRDKGDWRRMELKEWHRRVPSLRGGERGHQSGEATAWRSATRT